MGRNVAPIVAVVVALSVGGTGIAQGSSDPSDHLAKAAAKKKRHTLNVAYKSGQIDVIDEGTETADVVFQAYSKLKGRPFGAFKAQMNEERFLKWNVPNQIPRIDASATVQVTFTAVIRGARKSEDGRFRGFWNYSQDSAGNILSPITGIISSGSGKFKGAGGRFDVIGIHNTSNDPVRQEARWTGFIRY
jgi:hypothetical protein